MKRIVLLAFVAAACLQAGAHAQQGGLNTPVLPGLPADPTDPLAQYKSDVLEQRQVEPDILASTRNHLHLLSFFNDYRAVNLPDDAGQAGTFASRFKGFVDRVLAWVTRRPAKPALPAVAAAAEARIGLSRSYDGGLTWQGGLLPKIDGLDAMTDPKSAAAPCGIGYVSLIAFTRGGESKVVVWRFQDRNNLDGGDSWVSQGYSIVEVGSNASNGHFHDLPAIAVDPMRTATTGGDPCAHRVYLGWARFQGAEGAATLNFARTVTGDLAEGASWAPTWDKKYVKTTTKTEQGITLAVDPRPGLPTVVGGGGTVYYGWRVFQSLENPNGVWITSSKDFGATFPKAVNVTSGLPMHPFDQPTISTLAAGLNPELLAFRSNSLPTLQVGSTGTVFMAWQEKVGFDGCPNDASPINSESLCGLPSSVGEPRIVLTKSTDGGLNWTDYLGGPAKRRAVDFGNRDTTLPKPGFGYLPLARLSNGQVMPRLSFGGGRLGLLYFEARGPLTGNSALLAGINRQLDARYALLSPETGALEGTMQISRYPVKQGADLTKEEEADIAEVKPGFPRINKRVNAPNSANGTSPFIGDYLGTTPVVQFVFNPVTKLWRFALHPTDVPFQGFQAVFADSRNQGPPDGATPANPMIGSYGTFVPPGFVPDNETPPDCKNQSTRNHDVMHALVDASVAVNAIATFKQLGTTTERAFPLTVTNGRGVPTAFQLTFSPDIASWDQFKDNVDVLNVALFPYSSSTRVVYVKSQDPKASVTVTVREIVLTCTNIDDPATCTATLVPNGISGNVTLNLDPTNPIGAADPNDPEKFTDEHTPLVSNPLVSNHGPQNPLVSNTSLNPLVSNPLVSNPLVSNSTLSPLVSNPLVSNPSLPDNTMVHDIIDTSWKVTGGGTVASAMTAAVNVANAQALTGHFLFQLVIHKTSSYGGAAGCGAKDVIQDQIISSIPNPLVSNPLVSNPLVSNPLVSNPLVSNATFALSAPGDGGGGAASLSAMKVTQPALTPDDGLQMDFKPDAVFVTLRAYQLTATANLPPGVTYDPTAVQIAVFPQSVDVIQGDEQGDEPPPAGISFIVTSTSDSGAGSLREAIDKANANPGADNITFLIAPGGPATINLASALPPITSPVVIDGTTQPGFTSAPLIVLNGGGIGADGLLITSGSSVVRGLVIQSFGGNGIEISGPGGNLIEGNYIGTNAAGTAAQGNSGNGIQIIDSPNNTIGGTTPAARNVIAGNTGEEVRLDGANATGNMIRGNYIGTNAAGSAVVSSSNSGVFIRKAPGNSVIGNVVSGNTGFAGIAICGDPTTCGGGPDPGTSTSNATGNIVQGNFVGTDAAGLTGLGNGGYGVSIDSTPNTLIGGDTPGAGNLIAFNGLATAQAGVVVFGPGATGNRILRNSIHSNGGLGIQNTLGLNIGTLLSSAAQQTVVGSLSGTEGTPYVIDFYSSPICDPSGFGEGQTWVGSTTRTGPGPFTANLSTTVAEGLLITALATSTSEGTSEFSGCRTVLAPGFVDWPISQGGNGHVYEYVRAPGTWTSANTVASARVFRGVAGHLATITSAAENDVVTSLRFADPANGPVFDLRGWIGLTDSGTEGTFLWGTGETFSYSNWASGEPNNGVGLPVPQPPGEDFVEIFASGLWNDNVDAIGANQGYVVEYDVILHVPTNNAVIRQNRSDIGCSLIEGNETRGFGYRIDFDWSDASRAVIGYELFATKVGAALPIVNTTVVGSAFTHTSCNSFAEDQNLQGWEWRVRAKYSEVTFGDWTTPAPFSFEPCRLPDGSACRVGG